MRRSSWNYYGVKLIYQMIVSGDPIPERIDEDYSDTHTFFEESILLVRAQSFEHAYRIAERKAHEIVEGTHTNPYGQAVQWKLADAIDCYLIGDKITNGIELYSFTSPIKKEITPSEYLMQKYEYNLEDYDRNYDHEKIRRSLIQVLTYEKFSKWRKEP